MKPEDKDLAVGGLALLLVVSLVFFPFYSVRSFDQSATVAPDGWLGLIGMFAALVIVIEVVLKRFSPQNQLPNLGAGPFSTHSVLAAVTAVCIALKLLLGGDLGGLGWGFYVSIVAVVALLVISLQLQEHHRGT